MRLSWADSSNVDDFSIGDVVYVSIDWLPPYNNRKEIYTGVIVTIDNTMVGIRFDDDIGGHDLGGLCEDGHGYYLFPEMLGVVKHVENDIVESDQDISTLL